MLKQENAGFQNEVKALMQSTGEVKRVDEKLKMLEKDIANKELQQQELRQQLVLADAQRQSIALELASVQNKYAALQDEVVAQADVPGDLLEQIKTAQDQKLSLQEKLKQAVEELKSRSEKGLALLKEVKKLDADLAKSEEEKVVMAEEIVALREEKARLEEKIAQLQ